MELFVPGPVIVTGAASGIGAAVSRLLVGGGVQVGLIDRDATGLARMREELTSPAAATAVCDIADEESVERAFASLESSIGAATGYVLNAGIEDGSPIAHMPTGQWDRVQGTNLRGTFLCLRAALRSIESAPRQSSIVITGSPSARVAFADGGNAAYAASKAGVTALARNAAVEWASRGVRVNVVVPGATHTALMDGLGDTDETRARALASLAAEIPMGRVAEPDEPARAIAWLLSTDASYVTGAELPVDGGTLAKGSISR